MKILLGNTGRGGELAIFTSFVAAYRKAKPDAYLEVMTSDNGIYGSIFENHPGVTWTPLDFRDETKPYYMNPIECWNYHVGKRSAEFDIIEYICEHGLVRTNTTFSNLYSRIKTKLFDISAIQRRVVIYPTDQELAIAEDIHKQYPDLVLISHVCKSATVVFDYHDYQTLANKLARCYPVAFTGRLAAPSPDPPLARHLDLRGISFATLFALAQKLKFFVGPDTATTWIVTGMLGTLVCLRGCRLYTENNTGLLANGYRENENTLEWDIVHKPREQVIDRVVKAFRQ